MIDKQQIIIGYFRQGKSKKALVRELGLSKNTINKYIKEHELNTGPKQICESTKLPAKGVVSEPKYQSGNRSKPKLTDELTKIIRAYLEQNEIKKGQGKSKQQMLATDIHEALLDKGHQIGYRTVCRYIREVKQGSSEVFIRQHYSPGQAVEFDWGEVKLEIEGVNKRLMLAVFTSSYSNHRWACLYHRQDMSSFLHSHACYFSFTRGVAGQVVYDNMRVAVRKFTIRNSDKQPTEDLLKLSTYYQFDYRFCNAGRGNEKGHVERSVEFVRRKAFAPKDVFDSLEQANIHLEQTCQKLNQLPVKGKSESINSFFLQELKRMKPAPIAYDTAEIQNLRVDKYSCIKVDTNYYSVAEGHVGGFVTTKIYPHLINVYDSHNQLIGTHQRAHTRYHYYVNLEHYLKTLLKKPGALRGALSLQQADEKIKNIFYNHFKNRAKDFVELLILIKDRGHTITKLQQTIQTCIATCPHQPVCLDKIKYLLQQNQHLTDQQNNIAPTTEQMSKDITQFCTEQVKEIQSLFSLN